MNITGAGIFMSLFLGLIGFGLFGYGKKQQRPPQLVAGIVLMVFPYAVPDALAQALIGAGIIGLLWFLVAKRGL